LCAAQYLHKAVDEDGATETPLMALQLSWAYTTRWAMHRERTIKKLAVTDLVVQPRSAAPKKTPTSLMQHSL
jgi:hypothetical protein